jgi:hypothetical protein
LHPEIQASIRPTAEGLRAQKQAQDVAEALVVAKEPRDLLKKMAEKPG